MFDIGWTEILVLATVSLFIIGPKDIPKFLGYLGRIIAKVKGITSEFKETVDDAIKDTELEEIKKEISLSDPDISKSINEIINPTSNDKNIKTEEKKDNGKQATVNDTAKNLDSSSKEEASNDKKVKTENVAGPIESLPSGLKHIRSKDKR